MVYMYSILVVFGEILRVFCMLKYFLLESVNLSLYSLYTYFVKEVIIKLFLQIIRKSCKLLIMKYTVT